jgi:hypothetical protein
MENAAFSTAQVEPSQRLLPLSKLPGLKEFLEMSQRDDLANVDLVLAPAA